MKLTETTSLLSADIPVAEFSDFMRLGSGFTDDGGQDVLLETVLRAAMGAIEMRIGKILIARGFNWQIYVWRRDRSAQVLPVAPVNAISQIVMIDDLGVLTPVDAADYRLEFDSARPRIMPSKCNLPEVPVNGSAVVSFEAGFGIWVDIPSDLRQAVFLLAANYYENRNDLGKAAGQMPFGVLALLEPYRDMRLGLA
ncbi:MAG: head-tail connector protein [Rhodobacteraceae bacterium]|nr:head-tail connector protein [Paracoccaceae bacterium]